MEFSAPIACGRCLLVVLVFLSASAIAQETTIFTQPTPMSRPGCPTRCGNLTVAYPFGIGSGCAFDSKFQILCDGTDYNPPRLILEYMTSFGGRPIVNAISDRQIWISGQTVINNCYESNGTLVYRQYNRWNLGGGKFENYYSISPENKITTVGCDDIVWITDETTTTTGCTSSCSNASQVPHNGTCSGIGCCQFSLLPKGFTKVYSVSIVSNFNHTKVWSFNPCGHMFFGDTSRFRFLGASDLSNPNFVSRVIDSVATVLDWTVGDLSCKEAQSSSGYACQANTHCIDSDTGYGGYLCSCNHGYEGNPYLGCIAIRNSSCKEARSRSGYACQANSHCIDSDTRKGGYMCSCDDGYEGNPYLSPGCTDVDECKNPEMNTCELGCINIPGGFNCTCHEGYYGDGRKDGQGCLALNKNTAFPWLKVFIGIGLGIFILVAMATSLCYIIKKTNRANMRLKFFEQNGGFLLKQKITDGGSDSSDVTKIYSAKELTEATNNYTQDMILGRGGNGIVFKGILPNMLQVAIKR